MLRTIKRSQGSFLFQKVIVLQLMCDKMCSENSGRNDHDSCDAFQPEGNNVRV